MKIRPLILALLAGLALGGCSGSQVGPSFETGPDGTFKSRNAGGENRVTLARGGELWSTESTVPGSYTELYDRNGNAVAAIGPRSRLMILPWFGEEMKLASDTDITIAVEAATMPDGTRLKGLSFTTLASPVVKAQNEALDRFAEIIKSRDAHSAETLLADTAAVQAIVSALGPPALEILKAIALGG